MYLQRYNRPHVNVRALHNVARNAYRFGSRVYQAYQNRAARQDEIASNRNMPRPAARPRRPAARTATAAAAVSGGAGGGGVGRTSYRSKRRKPSKKKRKSKKKKRKAKAPKAPKIRYTSGVSEVVEFRGSYDDLSYGCVYLGHGSSSNRVFYNVIRCVVKELAHQMGQQFANFEDLVVTPLRTKWYVNILQTPGASPTPAETAYSFVGDVGNTYNVVVNNLVALIRLNVTASTPVELTKFYVNDPFQDTGSSGEPRIASIEAKQFFVNIFYKSGIKIQNRTLANRSDEFADPYAANDITNNPLVGKLYKQQKKWANCVTPVTRTGVATDSLVLDDSFGYLACEGITTEPELLKKPPPPWVLGYKSAVNVKVPPGAILKDSHTFSCKMSLSTYFEKNPIIIDMGPQTVRNIHSFGKVGLVALEKELDSIGDGFTATQILVGFQVDQTYKVSYKYSPRIRTIPYLDIVATPVIEADGP